MEDCLYKGKSICAYDVIYLSGVINEELEDLWRTAGADGELECPECHRPVKLRVKNPEKRVPHFAHIASDIKCDYGEFLGKESNEHKQGKLLIYNYLKDIYPKENVQINKVLSNKRRADVYVDFKDGTKLAIEYQRDSNNYNELKDKENEYNLLGINYIWLFKGKEDEIRIKETQNQINSFERLILNNNYKVGTYLDLENKKFILVRNLEYRNEYKENDVNKKLFIKSYNIDEVKINKDGSIICDFIELYKKEEEKFINQQAKLAREIYEIEERTRLERKRQREVLLKQREHDAIREKERIRSRRENYIYKNDNDKPIWKACIKDINSVLCNNNIESRNILIYKIKNKSSLRDREILTSIFKYIYYSGNDKAYKLYKEVMKSAGCNSYDFGKKGNVKMLKCPCCGKGLREIKGRCKNMVECIDKCGFAFNFDNR
ncbi:competence protein CoiA family protein [Clostridium baratii]|uniref:competence protein CoiA family protein n=1 Tax=Clostridium baratii TaxID=1561 RepID=UPI00097FA8C3|nr:competence protein CoiA family protein [Clostridium baratii]AQM60223.1 hypothetical protein NPD11_800 [Clostridium baratii]